MIGSVLRNIELKLSRIPDLEIQIDLVGAVLLPPGFTSAGFYFRRVWLCVFVEPSRDFEGRDFSFRRYKKTQWLASVMGNSIVNGGIGLPCH
jgi:hypothetical protein